MKPRRADTAHTARPLYPGGATTYLYEHRAFTRLPHRTRTLLSAAFFGLAATVAWLLVLPTVTLGWGYALVALNDALGTDGHVVMTVYEAWSLGTFGVPHLSLTASHPGPWLIGTTGLVTLLLFLASFRMPEEWTPGLYVLRTALLIQASAVFYFTFWGRQFPYTLDEYLMSIMATGVIMISVTPLVLGLTYYVQDVSWTRKVGLTLTVIGYAVVLVPIQYLVQAIVLHHISLLFLPLLYILFGIPLHVLTLVALYAWGMSWKGSHPTLGIPAEPANTPTTSPLRQAA